MMIDIALPKGRAACLLFVFLFTVYSLPSFSCPPDKGFLKMADGIIIYPDSTQPGHTRSVKIRVVTANIIRVTASPLTEPEPVNSLMTAYEGLPVPKWSVEKGERQVVLKTDSVTATISTETGAVSFSDFLGNLLVSEKNHNGRSFEPTVLDGQLFYHIRQTFDTRPGEAFYGLGQHQDGIYNYNHHQVTLFQNNSEIAVPFLVSNRNYGILLDNYSISRMGDIRPFLDLSRLRLFAKDGTEGFLDESFINMQEGREKLLLTRPASSVDLSYLNDSGPFFPKGFGSSKGIMILEGSIASSFTGDHQFRFLYGGYIKVWLDGKEILERWRQAWNPATALLDRCLRNRGRRVCHAVKRLRRRGVAVVPSRLAPDEAVERHRTGIGVGLFVGGESHVRELIAGRSALFCVGQNSIRSMTAVAESASAAWAPRSSQIYSEAKLTPLPAPFATSPPSSDTATPSAVIVRARR